MNAAFGCLSAEIAEPVGLELAIPELAWRRLRLSLGRARANGEAWDACIRYGAPLPLVERLLDYWCDELDVRAVEARLDALPLFGWRWGDEELAFVHARSHDAGALPLLWLHGASGSIAEGLRVVEALTTRAAGPGHDSFHVVCPALPGRASSRAAREGALASVATWCADLMATLGYARYSVHGSGVGASVAAELCRLAPDRVIALHVTSLAAFPTSEPFELGSLSADEKSRLARLDELHTTCQHIPRTAMEQLAVAACQLADDELDTSLEELAPELLWGLSYEFLRSDPEFRAALAQPPPAVLERSEVPAGVCSFPLGRPSLRRFAERAQRVVAWSEHEHGGELALLEQPQALLQSLRTLCAELRSRCGREQGG